MAVEVVKPTYLWEEKVADAVAFIDSDEQVSVSEHEWSWHVG
jgi:hypothetical protein